MTTILTTSAIEKSVYPITVSFTDETGAAKVPTTITWTLTDTAGNVVNSRSAVSIAAPAASVTIVLSGNDLAILPSLYGRERVLLIEATYTGSLGSGLPWKDEVHFTIDDLLKVT